MMIQLLMIAVLSAAFDTKSPARPEQGRSLEKKVLVELFTSQGCSSCPPAEAGLVELKHSQLPPGRIIPLAFHVDYWDRLGWKDLFSSHAFTVRQIQYARVFNIPQVYTPQAVVDGSMEMVGSHRQDVLEAVKSRLARPGGFFMAIRVDTYAGRPARVRVDVMPAARSAVLAASPRRSSSSGDPKWIFAAAFLPEWTTRVLAGENAGMAIHQIHIVKALADPIPFHAGSDTFAAAFNLPLSPGDHVAAWIQDYKTFAVDQAVEWPED